MVSEKFITINLLFQRILLQSIYCYREIYYKQFIVSELDLYVYILELTAKPEFVSDSTFITIEDANAFNLLDDFGQVSMLQEILGGVLNTLDFEPVGDISPNNIHSYRAILKHIR